MLRPVLVAVVSVLALTAGCGGGGDAGSASSVAKDAGGAAAAPAAASRESRARTAMMTRAVVSTGAVDIAGRDLGRARAQVDRVLAGHGATLADATSRSDRSGRTQRTRLVVRVPSGDFAATMDALVALDGVRSSSRSSDDVTTQVIDVDQRVTAQRLGLRRVEALVSRAGSLTEVLALEKEITRRRGELDSLVQQQAYLADQTSLSTITIVLDRAAPPPPASRPAGFGSGLGHGWHALGLVLAGTLTGVGAALPFAVVLALVGVPVWIVVRRRRKAQPA